ncbi:MAG: FadR family transcriptional regulator [Geminicoccaceae bacterium]|nr:MAG: FadR family transcriptional regulator [Geminicoccaceae bacterium]
MDHPLRDHAGDPTLVQLRAWLARAALPEAARLPSERELCAELGVSRGDLRKALGVLEREGAVWRHVGKGTFVGSAPLGEVADLAAVERRTNPAEVMRTRLMIEPVLAREAALYATPTDLEELRLCLQRARAATSWRQYETQDNALHRAVAKATHNTLALALFDTLNTVRRAVVWGRLRAEAERPPADHHSFAEHETIVAAIAERDLHGAAQAMDAHLRTVERRLTMG